MDEKRYCSACGAELDADAISLFTWAYRGKGMIGIAKYSKLTRQ